MGNPYRHFRPPSKAPRKYSAQLTVRERQYAARSICIRLLCGSMVVARPILSYHHNTSSVDGADAVM